jgi:hypothetical protein
MSAWRGTPRPNQPWSTRLAAAAAGPAQPTPRDQGTRGLGGGRPQAGMCNAPLTPTQRVPQKKHGQRKRGQGRLLTLAIIAEAHLCLPQANRVLSRADAIELLELGLLDILQRLGAVSDVGEEGLGGNWGRGPTPRACSPTHLAGGVDLDGLDADVLRTGGHCGQAIGGFWARI